MLNVAVIGNNKLAVEVLEFLYNDPDVCPLAVLNPNDTGIDGNNLSLKRFANENDIPIIQPNTINQPSTVAFLQRWKPYMILSCSYAKILKEPAINTAKICLNFHFALLPKYRGCMPIINALACGENQIGVTLHKISTGIDSGDILDQEPVNLKKYTTAEEAYVICNEIAINMLKKWWPAIKTGRELSFITQDLANSSYFSFGHPNNRWIDWNWSAEKVAGFINALTNKTYPAARTVCLCGEIELLGRAEVIEDQDGVPGKVLSKTDGKIVVATGTRAVVFSEVRPKDGVFIKNGDVFVSPREGV